MAASASVPEIRDADPDDPAAQACLAAYFALLAQRIDGVVPQMFPLPLPDAADYRAPRGLFLLAWAGARPVGCVSLHGLGAQVAEVKRLWVDPVVRGQGVARRLMRVVEDRARQMGFIELKLDSNRALAEAIALYRADGWTETPPYTGFPADIWLAKPL